MYHCNISFCYYYINFRSVEVGEETNKFEVNCIMYSIVYLPGSTHRGGCQEQYWGQCYFFCFIISVILGFYFILK